MPGHRKRCGTTLVELSLVIAILAMIVLPFVAFISQNLKNTVQSSAQLEEQSVLEQIMQDMEKHLRSAISVNGMTPCPITFPTGGISFTSRDPQALIGNVPATASYAYVLASGLVKRNNATFPDGLESGLVTSVTFPGPQDLTAAPPAAHFITVRLEAYNATLGTATYLQKTIYLRNY
jgi:Tfp pilus assembly protein PilE